MVSRWSYVFLALLLLGHLALLSNRPEARGSPLEGWLLALFAPLGDAVDATAEAMVGATHSLRSAGALRRENRRLAGELAEARRELARLHGMQQELEGLRRHLGYRRATSVDSYVADVVYVDRASWLRTLVIHGGRERPRRNQPVVTDRGLVGRVVVAAGHYAKVQLITDRSASASAMVRRTRRQGQVQGRGAAVLWLSDIPGQSDVRVGDRVVTAGLDGIYPRGLPIGVVRSVRSTQGLFQRIEVTPAVDFGLLDRVFVLRDDPLPEEVRDELLRDEPPPESTREPPGEPPGEPLREGDG